MKQHIAFLPSSGIGHIFPLFRLAEKLALHHHHHFHVSFIVVTTNASATQTNFLNSPAVHHLPNFTVVNLPPADLSGLITGEMRLGTQLSILTRESLKPLKTILAELNPKYLVIDIFTTDAIDVCRELDIPVYSFFTASTSLFTFSLYLPTLDREMDAELVEFPSPVEVPGCRSIRKEDLLDQVKDRKNDEYKWMLHHFSRLPETAGIILNVWEDFDSERFQALKENPFFKSLGIPPLYPIGPLMNDGGGLPPENEIGAWLDSQPRESVVYVSFGSAGTLSSEQLTELAWGLERSRQRFILVARRPADASVSAGYFTVGSGDYDVSAYLPEGFLERNRGVGVVVAEWAPQQAVLRHPSTAAFVTHCGWNSVMESLVGGVPMIAWPLYTEQRMNAVMLVEEVGVAVRMAAEEAEAGSDVIGREVIERVVREVVEGEGGKAMRRRARELRESAKMAIEEGGSSDLALRRIMEIWGLENK